jgi:hypothetical protein
MPQNMLMRQPAWNFEVPNVNNLLQPIQGGIDRYNRQEQQAVENERADQQLGMQRERLGFERSRMARQDESERLTRLGKMAAALHTMPDTPEKAARAKALLDGHADLAPQFARYGINGADPVAAVGMLAQSWGDYDQLARTKAQAEINRTNASTSLASAQAEYYRAKSRPDPTPAAAAAPAASDPIAQGYGVDDEGNLRLPPSQSSSGPSYADLPGPTRLPSSGAVMPGVTMARPFPEPMRLGGPMDDIERSMRLDEGRPQGVRIAQAGPPTNLLSGPPPGATPLESWRNQSFGPAGVQSPEVRGIVTDAGRNRRSDPLATRELQGQRALESASPEDQQRLARFRTEQEMWTGVYRRPPRAGYYYAPDGREMPLTDKNFKGDRESQAVALMNMNKIEAAGDVLLGKRTGRVDERGQPIRESGPYLATRAIAGSLNMGDIGQAYADMRQGALGIAYALSGKTVAVAEMKNFIEAYGPTPLDSPERIASKMQRMRDFYQALLTASRGGVSYETAFARAMAATGLRNPDGTPAGEPAAASGGTRPPPANDVRGMSTEDLVRRLNSGR